MRLVSLVICTVLMLTLLACGGGGGGGNSGDGLAHLAGSWFGTMMEGESPYVLRSIRVEIDGSGNITGLDLDGAGTGVTGTIIHTQANVYAMFFSNATEGGFMLDPGGNHAAVITSDNNMSAVQRGASALLPPYLHSDLLGSWSGTEVTVDFDFFLASVRSSNVTIVPGGGFAGGNSAGMTFMEHSPADRIGSDSDSHGYFSGLFDSANPSASDRWIDLVMTPDRTFVACALRRPPFPQGQLFHAWKKQ